MLGALRLVMVAAVLNIPVIKSERIVVQKPRYLVFPPGLGNKIQVVQCSSIHPEQTRPLPWDRIVECDERITFFIRKYVILTAIRGTSLLANVMLIVMPMQRCFFAWALHIETCNWYAFIICGFGVPIDVPRTSLTYGLILKTNYVLPNNATQFTDPYVAFAKRSVGLSRWHLYKAAEALLNRLGLGGRDCLLRSICEAAETPLQHNGILGELLYVLLTPTSTADEPIDASAREYYAAERQGRMLTKQNNATGDCAHLYSNCEAGLLDLISTLVSDSLL